MSADTTGLSGTPEAPGSSRPPLDELVRGLVAEVLMVPAKDVLPQTALVQDLGAESIDFIDLVFRLEQALGRKIPVARWAAFVLERLSGQDLNSALTTEIVREFAEREATRT